MATYSLTTIEVQGEPQQCFEVYADESREQTLGFVFDEDGAKRLARREPLRVLVTVSGGVAHVDYCPEGVTVEVRDFDTRAETGAPTCEEHGPGGTVVGVSVERVPGERDEWRATDNARPEFDGVQP